MNNATQAQQLATGAAPTIVPAGPDINMGNLIDEFRQSKNYTQQYTRDFVRLDDLVDAVPTSNESDVPFVGDTTLPGLVRSIPRKSLQQLPTFQVSVNGSKNNIPAIICSYLLRKIVFNEDTFGKGLLSTLQIGTEQALTHGYAPFMAATGTMYQDFGTIMRLLHYSDTYPEPGIQDSNEGAYHYVVAHLTKSRLRKILASAQKNANTTWNVDALKKLLGTDPRPTNYSQYMTLPRQNGAGEAMSPTYEVATRYETGQGGTIVTFAPDMSDEPLRVLESRSKWGYPRVMYLVIDPAALTPFGVSRVRLASPNQNLMNIYYGNIAAMLLLNSRPPIFKRGRFTTPVELKQGAVWETLDPTGEAKLQNLDNGALEFFPEMARTIAGQIQNIMGGQTMAIDAGSKSGFGHTAPGEKRAQEFMDIDTNQTTKILENFLRQYALVALDTIISEQEGTDPLLVDDEAKNAINQLAQGTIGDDNKFEMSWEEFYAGIEEWTTEISVSVSKDQLEDKRRGDLQDMLTVLGQNAAELGPSAVAKVEEITNLLLQDAVPEVGQITGTPPALGGPSIKPPSQVINYKDVAGSPAGTAMLAEDHLPAQ